MTESPQDPDCPCCLGDPDTVCDACGSHACWAGDFMCSDAATAGTRQAGPGDVLTWDKRRGDWV